MSLHEYLLNGKELVECLGFARIQAPKKYTNLLSDDINTALIYFQKVKMLVCN